jgi:hypothetical protein
MISDFCIQFVIKPKTEITWADLNKKVDEVKEILVINGLKPGDFCVTDDPTFEKELRIDLGLSATLEIDFSDILTFLRKRFKNLYFIETLHAQEKHSVYIGGEKC